MLVSADAGRQNCTPRAPRYRMLGFPTRCGIRFNPERIRGMVVLTARRTYPQRIRQPARPRRLRRGRAQLQRQLGRRGERQPGRLPPDGVRQEAVNSPLLAFIGDVFDPLPQTFTNDAEFFCEQCEYAILDLLFFPKHSDKVFKNVEFLADSMEKIKLFLPRFVSCANQEVYQRQKLPIYLCAERVPHGFCELSELFCP